MGATVLSILLWKQVVTEPAPVEAKASPPALPLDSQASTSLSLQLSVPVPPVQTAPLPEQITAVARLNSALASAPADQQETAARLQAFATDGDLSQLDDVTAEEVEALAATLLNGAAGDELNQMLEEGINLPPDFLRAHPNPARAVADLFQAVKGTGDPSITRSLVFTDHCEENGAATGSVHVIPQGTRRVYAAFENAGGLHGLQNVFAVWRDPSDTRMVFAEYEPVRFGSAFNYVWLELNDGWPAGHYELALYHPQRTTELLASRSFNVR